MRYLLTIAAPPSRELLEETVASFRERVTPRPVEVFVVDDGRKADALHSSLVADIDAPRRRIGRCRVAGRCWSAAARSGLPWVLHLDGMVRFTRSVDLSDLAHVVTLEPAVATMSLPSLDVPRDVLLERMGAGSASPWISSPVRPAFPVTLTRARLCRAFPWPQGRDGEEDLWRGVEAAMPGLRYGIWGLGTPWVTDGKGK